MLEKLLFSSLVTLSSLFLAIESSVASEHNAFKYSSSHTGSVPVEADMRYSENDENQFLTNFKVRITREKKTIVDSALPVKLLPNYDKESGVNAIGADIKVIDLDANGEPEIVVDLTEAGAHCCSSTFIYSYNSKAKHYNVLSHFWGNYTSGYWLEEVSGKEDDRNLTDLNGDGSPEFVALDDRFRGEFGGYAVSAAPVQIWRYSRSEMVNVTKEFPKLVYHSAADLWQMYSQIRSEYGAESAQGAMAAYVGAKFLLGQQADAMQRLRQAYPDSRSQKFINDLMSFLRKTGYARWLLTANPEGV